MLSIARSGFDLDRFISDCRAALREDPPQKAVREVLARVLAGGSLKDALGEPGRAQIGKLHHGPDLTILNVTWAPEMTVMPHDHRMWAVIGIYAGREDNIFWRRITGEADGLIEAAGARALSEGDCCALGHGIIHSVVNPIPRFTGALHIYGGDFFAQARSEWDPETLLERPYSSAKTLRMFEEANRRALSAAE
jgi:predicted metal-dependent enzyme (double-stranded beta helix superfamily)